MGQRHRILVVDDERVNRQLLSNLLQDDYDIILAKNGMQALARLESDTQIELVLLDIMMPEMDGLEVLRRIKANDAIEETPVIIISALDTVGDEEKGLRLGAVDYIGKPFQPALVQLRVNHQIAFLNQYRELNRYRQELEELVDLRTRELIQAEKMASLGTLAAGVAHEINNPVSVIQSNVTNLRDYLSVLLPMVEDYRELARTRSQAEPVLAQRLRDRLQGEDLDFMLQDIDSLLSDVSDGGKRVAEIVAGLRSFARADDSKADAVDLNECVDTALNLAWNEIKYKAEVDKRLEDLPRILANEGQITQVLVNLLVNAAQAIEEQGRIEVETRALPGEIRLSVRDNGKGIPSTDVEHLFEPFFTTKEVGTGTGLGLSISHGIVESHGGRIDVESEPGKGARFTIVFPLQQRPAGSVMEDRG